MNIDNVRDYDCAQCLRHFSAETPTGDAYAFKPKCEGCGSADLVIPCKSDFKNEVALGRLVAEGKITVGHTFYEKFCVSPFAIHAKPIKLN